MQGEGGLNVNGRAWQEDGTLSARYWSVAAKLAASPARASQGWFGGTASRKPVRSSEPRGPELECRAPNYVPRHRPPSPPHTSAGTTEREEA